MSKRHRRVRPTASTQPLPREFLAVLAQLPAPLRAPAYRLFWTRPACLLCQAEFYAVGAWVPPDPEALGLVPPEHQHGWVFGLCRFCVSLRDRPSRVEAVLMRSCPRAAARWN